MLFRCFGVWLCVHDCRVDAFQAGMKRSAGLLLSKPFRHYAAVTLFSLIMLSHFDVFYFTLYGIIIVLEMA